MDLYLMLLIASGVIILILTYLYLVTLQDNNDLRLRYAVLNSRYEEEMKSSQEKLEIMKNAKEELSREFKLLANKIFDDKSKKFNHTHKEQFEMLLRPFREQITNFSTQSS